MRITNRMMVDNVIQNVTESLEKSHKLRRQISTGKQFQNPSEEPVRSSLSLSLRSNLRTMDSFVDTADSTKDWMYASDLAFDEFETIANRATTLVLKGLNDTISGKERQTTLGTEMQALTDHALEIGNTIHNGQYIFAGYKVTTRPFSLAADPASTYTDFYGATQEHRVLTYSGDTGVMQRSLAPDQNVTLNITGDQAIRGFLENLVRATEAMNRDTTAASTYDPGELKSALTALQNSLNTLDQYRTSNGARLRQVETAADFLAQVKIETQGLLSKKEDTNVAEAIAQLTNQETTFSAVLEVSQRAISTMSLFDYLQ